MDIGDQVLWEGEEFVIKDKFDTSEGRIYTPSPFNPSNMIFFIIRTPSDRKFDPEVDTAWVPEHALKILNQLKKR